MGRVGFFTNSGEESFMHRPVRFISSLAFAAVVAAAPAAADTWKIDGTHSSAQFSVKHLMISKVRGEFGTMSGTVEFDGKSVASIKVDATIDAASITTRDEKRDGHLKSPEFFDVAKYPTLNFKSKKAVEGAGGAFQLVGELTMHGVTKEITLDVTPLSPIIKGMRGEARVATSATTTINRQDFGVTWNAPMDGGGVVVGDNVTITIDIEAMIPPPAAPPKAPPPAKP
jgi:polyisoprenoid-binding protein YceI